MACSRMCGKMGPTTWFKAQGVMLLKVKWPILDCVGLGTLVREVPKEFLDHTSVPFEEGGVWVVDLLLRPLNKLALRILLRTLLLDEGESPP